MRSGRCPSTLRRHTHHGCWLRQLPLHPESYEREYQVRGTGRVLFAASCCSWAPSTSSTASVLCRCEHFRQRHEVHTHNLNSLGWVLIILGAIQLTAGFSLIAGNIRPGGRDHRRQPGCNRGPVLDRRERPVVVLFVCALCVWVVYGIVVYGRRPEGGWRSLKRAADSSPGSWGQSLGGGRLGAPKCAPSAVPVDPACQRGSRLHWASS